MPSGLDADALAAAEAESDPDSLAAAGRLRRRFGGELAAVALDQAQLRRRARAKFGEVAARMFFTRDGLEQATRPTVAVHHAERLAATGVRRVFDLGCGIGADASALCAAGLEVVAVERDPWTAEVARANLATAVGDGPGSVEVITGDAERVAEELITDADAVFLDPARRTTSGRLWRAADFSPGWDVVTEMLQRDAPTAVKLGPALPHREIVPGVEAEWVSDHGETVEVSLWSGPGSTPDLRAGLIMPDDRLVATSDRPPVRSVGRYLYEPDGAVIRSGGIGVLAGQLSGWLIEEHLAYLSSEAAVQTPYATCFEITETLPYKEKVLRRWIRDHGIGRLEIKKRGIEVDPAQLRRRLRPSGDAAATMIITRTPDGAAVYIGRRL